MFIYNAQIIMQMGSLGQRIGDGNVNATLPCANVKEIITKERKIFYPSQVFILGSRLQQTRSHSYEYLPAVFADDGPFRVGKRVAFSVFIFVFQQPCVPFHFHVFSMKFGLRCRYVF